MTLEGFCFYSPRPDCDNLIDDVEIPDEIDGKRWRVCIEITNFGSRATHDHPGDPPEWGTYFCEYLNDDGDWTEVLSVAEWEAVDAYSKESLGAVVADHLSALGLP